MRCHLGGPKNDVLDEVQIPNGKEPMFCWRDGAKYSMGDV